MNRDKHITEYIGNGHYYYRGYDVYCTFGKAKFPWSAINTDSENIWIFAKTLHDIRQLIDDKFNL